MKLFDDFEAVRFPEENLLLVARGGYLYYIFDPKYRRWEKYKNAGCDRITVCNYQEVGEEEITDAMHGVFPKKETDFMRLCHPSELCADDMLKLLRGYYHAYMSAEEIDDAVYEFLSASVICYQSFLKLKILFGNALQLQKSNEEVLEQIKELCFAVIGRDIFKREIGIVDGHDGSSYFSILPVRVIDDQDTNDLDSVAEMKSAEISIEEDDVAQYLTPFLYKYFDEELEANKRRVDDCRRDNAGNEHISYVSGFEWYSTNNFYSFDSVKNIIKDIADTIDALTFGRSNEYTAKLKEKRGMATYELLYAKDLSQEQIDEYNASRPQEDNTEIELIIDFYRRFIYRMKYMMSVGKEKGYNLISFMGL